MSIRLLHFADAHIDMANYGRHDPATGLPQRVVDFLNALDQIVDAAIAEKVDLVLFAGDAYKDRNPQPTFQREWGLRMKRLSDAGIATLLLIGNHDMAPAEYRAHTLQEFKTLGIPNIYVADEGIKLWQPNELGVPVQVITMPWITRSRYMARAETTGMTTQAIFNQIGDRLTKSIADAIAKADPQLPLVFMAHASVAGAAYGSERQVMLGQEMVLDSKLVFNEQFDYVALGHIHKHQALSERPPVVYSGSIERIDFGEAREAKGYVMAELDRGKTSWRFVPLKTRPFLDVTVDVREAATFMDSVMRKLPSAAKVKDAVVRVTLVYPHELDSLLDEEAIRDHLQEAFDLRLVRHRLTLRRARLGEIVNVSDMAPLELLDLYWQSREMADDDRAALMALAREVIAFDDNRYALSGADDFGLAP